MKNKLTIYLLSGLLFSLISCERNDEPEQYITEPILLTPNNQGTVECDSVLFKWAPSNYYSLHTPTEIEILYELFISQDNKTWETKKVKTPCEINVKSLNENQTYYWKVRAYEYQILGADHESFSKVYSFQTSSAVVTNLKSHYNNEEIRLTWDEASETDHVEITFSPEISSIKQPILVLAGTKSVTLTGLKNFTKYTFELKRVTTKGNISKGKFIQEIPLDTRYNVRDGNFNIYNVVTIGNQVWMRENLKATRANDGTDFEITQTGQYITNRPFYNEGSQSDKYGYYYNSFLVSKYKEQANKICPIGYHIPSDEDWEKLELFLGMSPNDLYTSSYNARGFESKIGYQLKSTTGWDDCNDTSGSGNGSDKYNFSVLPGGAFLGIITEEKEIGKFAYFLSTKMVDNKTYVRVFAYGSVGIFKKLEEGFCSIRCVKDSE